MVQKEKVDPQEIPTIQEEIKEIDTETKLEIGSNKFLFDVEGVRNSLNYLYTDKIKTII